MEDIPLPKEAAAHTNTFEDSLQGPHERGANKTTPYPKLLKGSQVRVSFHKRQLSIASEIALGLCLFLDQVIVGKFLVLPTMQHG